MHRGSVGFNHLQQPRPVDLPFYEPAPLPEDLFQSLLGPTGVRLDFSAVFRSFCKVSLHVGQAVLMPVIGPMGIRAVSVAPQNSVPISSCALQNCIKHSLEGVPTPLLVNVVIRRPLARRNPQPLPFAFVPPRRFVRVDLCRLRQRFPKALVDPAQAFRDPLLNPGHRTCAQGDPPGVHHKLRRRSPREPVCACQ